MGTADCLRSYIRLLARNQVFKTLENVDQMITQALRDGSRDQAAILTIKFLIVVADEVQST